MEGYRIAKQDNRIYSMGLTGVDGGIHMCVAAQGEVCDLLLYRSGEETEYARLHFPQEGKRGDVWNMTVLGDFQDWSTASSLMESRLPTLTENSLPEERSGVIYLRQSVP